ncbi:MAG: glycoside hydrolase family 99-like domain-containing protein [Acetobacter orientalis]|uniref:glycoside hydrolase family 99-like domain-containing protein n=2 Tax=Acetobacter orientalis TaxID=146474 RepID=UPI0039E77597
MPDIYIRAGGIENLVKKTYSTLSNEGVSGIKRRFLIVESIQKDKNSNVNISKDIFFHVVPHYVDPQIDFTKPIVCEDISVGIHIHLFYVDMIDEVVTYFSNIPYKFDLYISIVKNHENIDIINIFRNSLPQAQKIIIRIVPNRGRDLAPFIIEFGEILSKYDICGHFHTKKSLHNKNLSGWFKDIYTLLLGAPGSSGGRVVEFFNALMKDVKIVYPEGRNEFFKDPKGWGGNYINAKKIIQKYTNLSIKNFPLVEFPEGSMFWARSKNLKEFLSMRLTYNNFPPEPIGVDGTLAHTLERLILLFSASEEGKYWRIHSRDSISDYRYYEPSKDYSNETHNSDVKILTYYLPQFHPTPENDEWHGKGFTEWTKVRAANPLFVGHYQQHIPHNDIGYYFLENPEILRQQAEMMKRSGVYGQIFYHYWFDGVQILEKPVKMLLDSPDIKMPYCFCWANENWTRRWDGNEQEILLKQNYSSDDAYEFIKYLIPFFQDERYIRIDDRPVLYIYRPSSIPNMQTYLDAWEVACLAAGLRKPYVIGVLTRGFMDPNQSALDAGVERVLHDWTNGGVPEIKNTLNPYEPINGSVISYEDVAKYYSNQEDEKDFTYFRSIIPAWDNTARYGGEAFIVHNSNPEVFQKWLETLIFYTRKTLPADRRFLIVNAWNEWAEGAHLEPDSRYGYSYLNSVGRALSGRLYEADLNAGYCVTPHAKLHITFSDHALDCFNRDLDMAMRFFHCLSHSSIFGKYNITIDLRVPQKWLENIKRCNGRESDYTIQFRNISFFSSSAIEKMLKMATFCVESVIIPNFYNNNSDLVAVTGNGSVDKEDAYYSPLMVYPTHISSEGYKNFRMRTDTYCFEANSNLLSVINLPIVTTIIRVHKDADFRLLSDAICCLQAMYNCVCIPLIAVQDFSEEQKEKLKILLKGFLWRHNCEPQVYYYDSLDGNQDLRSKMLNESLRYVKTRYVGFLDYDDLLMPCAYNWLINRLQITNKAVSFGRVYSTLFKSENGIRYDRRKSFEYGYSYKDFIMGNHAPLHSFLMDCSKIDIKNIEYFDDHKYMEDYYLTLQIFNEENCDWDSLRHNVYIGDYMHSIDRSHTLAFHDESSRKKTIETKEYIDCELRIKKMKLKIIN